MNYKYEVEIHQTALKQKIPESVKEEMRSSGMANGNKINIKGVSQKMLRRMKSEYVECPVLGTRVVFLQCFMCPNFQSRVSGKVLCKGAALPAAGAQDTK